MRVADFDYELPPERIAQRPVEPRDAARLFVHRVGADATEHRRVRDLPELLAAGDLLVVNETKVRAARLCGRKASGGAVECLLLEARGPDRWRAQVGPSRRLRPGDELELEGGALRARLVERLVEDDAPGAWLLQLVDPAATGAPVAEIAERVGRMPLPPYVKRPRGDDPRRAEDRERYQTVFAREPGAVAAPTAGLHFTFELFGRLAAAGVERTEVTLHVGEGTFRPVTAEDTADHAMHAEAFDVPVRTAEAVDRCRRRGGRVVAVGTTVVRTLESSPAPDRRVAAGHGSTELFLTPGSELRVVDALLTNFHLPRSTLLMLVAAFAGRERILRLYREAVERGYRFYSYGDAMLLLP